MINLGRTEEGPGEKGILDRGLASSRGSRGCWGNAAHDYKRSGIPFQPSKKGRSDSSAPLSPFLPAPRAGISNSDDEIAAELGGVLISVQIGHPLFASCPRPNLDLSLFGPLW
jgi:hypothetical protein